jgi:DNA repair protein RecO (recombination protein O)
VAAARTAARAAAPLAAYVLHRWDWSETSLVVELFTRALGRVVVVARGAKRPTSQLRAVLLPFQPLTATLGRAPADEAGEVHPLRAAEWAGGAPLLPAAALLPGYYLNELLMKLLARQDPHPGLFDAYADTLSALATATGGDTPTPADAVAPGEAATLRAFELLLLREAGLLPDLAHDSVTAQPLRPARGYTLHAEAGLVPLDEPGAAEGRHWLALEQTLAAAATQGHAGALRAACAPVAAALRGPLRKVLHYHLGTSALRTREVRQALQRLAPLPLPATAAAPDA